MKRENYVVVQGFMVKDLKLKGNELITFAVIYGFSQDGETRFTGSLAYLAEWGNCTKQAVMNSLKSLQEKGLIDKYEKVVNGVKFCEYSVKDTLGVLKKVSWGGKESLMGGGKKSLPNNIITNNLENNKDISVVGIFKESGIDESLFGTVQEFIKMRKMNKNPMTDEAIKLLLNKLKKLSTDTEEQKAILEQAILHGWQSVYPLKKEKANYTFREPDYNANKTDEVRSREDSLKQIEAFQNKVKTNRNKG